HRAGPREDAREGSEAEHPPEQDEGADRDDEDARRSREGVEPRDERGIELARAGRHADPRCRRSIVHVRSARSAVPGQRAVSVQADGRPARCDTSVTSSEGSKGLARYTWKPARSARVRSAEVAYAVSAAAGVFPPRSASSVRMQRISWCPSMTGIEMSLTM